MSRVRIAVMVLACLAACSEKPPAVDSRVESAAPLQVYAVNYPLAWAAETLAGDAADVHFDLPADIDPAWWEPAPEILASWQQADLVLLNGAGYAAWLDKVSLRDRALVRTSSGFANDYIPLESGPVHSHGPGGEHSHGAVAFTLWLDLAQYRQQVEVIAAALGERLPAERAAITARTEGLREQLEALDQRLLKLGADLAAAPLLYSHPVYQYLDRRYGLNGFALHWEPGRPPDLAELDEVLARHPAKLMLWEDEPLAETRAALAGRGVEVVVYRPSGNRPASGDFLDVMLANVSALEAALINLKKASSGVEK